jgi:hypothetical protein
MKILNTPIEMIALHEKDGGVRPIRFRITGDDEENRVIKINKVVQKSKEKQAGQEFIRYTCMVTLNDIQVLCELRFITSENRQPMSNWVLWKI